MPMSQTETVDSNCIDDPIVERFQDAFNFVDRADETNLYEQGARGPTYIERDNLVVLLIHDTTDGFGDVHRSGYEKTEYVRTETIEGDNSTNRAYGFTASDGTVHWANVEYVRLLANDVFDVSYDEMRSWAQTNASTSPDGIPDDRSEAPIMFDDPNSEWAALIAPVVSDTE